MDISLLRNIKMVVLDVDGVLTDGLIWLDSNNQWKRMFCVRDGVGLKMLMEEGYEVGIITGGKSEDVETRIRFLGIKHFYDGRADKRDAFDHILQETNLKPGQVLYMGDEVFDIPLIEKAGYGVTVPEAVPEVKAVAQYVTQTPGGRGAVREVCDMLRKYGHFASNAKELR